MTEPFDVDVQQVIRSVTHDLGEFLVDKNNAYGNSALKPARVFARSSTKEQLYVRIDDKLNRIMNGHEYPGDDTIDDLLGYLVLLKVYERIERARERYQDCNEPKCDQESCCQEDSGEKGPGETVSEQEWLGYDARDAEAVRDALLRARQASWPPTEVSQDAIDKASQVYQDFYGGTIKGEEGFVGQGRVIDVIDLNSSRVTEQYPRLDLGYKEEGTSEEATQN